MRVLETNSNPAYKMGKSKNKKHRIRKNKDADIGASDSSDDGLGSEYCFSLTDKLAVSLQYLSEMCQENALLASPSMLDS